MRDGHVVEFTRAKTNLGSDRAGPMAEQEEPPAICLLA